jgi:hypothetical protein
MRIGWWHARRLARKTDPDDRPPAEGVVDAAAAAAQGQVIGRASVYRVLKSWPVMAARYAAMRSPGTARLCTPGLLRVTPECLSCE